MAFSRAPVAIRTGAANVTGATDPRVTAEALGASSAAISSAAMTWLRRWRTDYRLLASVRLTLRLVRETAPVPTRLATVIVACTV
jgi:hypothetical protein